MKTRNEILDEVIERITSKTQNSYYRMPLAEVGRKMVAEIELMKDTEDAAADSVHCESQSSNSSPATGEVVDGCRYHASSDSGQRI